MGWGNDNSNLPSNFKIDDSLVSDPNIIANGFCSYFTNIGFNFAEKIPNSNNTAEYYYNRANLPKTPSILDQQVKKKSENLYIN